MADVPQLSKRQQECLEIIRGYGEIGCTLENVMEAMQINRASIYRHVDKLESCALIRREYKSSRDRRVWLIAGNIYQAMHILPPMGEVIPSRSVAKVLGDWRYAKHIAQWSAIKDNFYYFPHSLSLMAQNAIHWHSGGTFMPEKKEIERQRQKLLQIAQHARHLAMMCESLLNNETLWDRKHAYNSWFMDPNIPFTAEVANDSHKAITQLLNDGLVQAKGTPVAKPKEPPVD